MTPLIIYVAGLYTARTETTVDENVAAAVRAGQEIMRRGHHVICPQSMTHGWDQGTGLGYDDFMDNCLALVKRCDAICLLDGWTKSDGARREYEVAKQKHLRVFFGAESVPEVRS